jgi:hypothetical protein
MGRNPVLAGDSSIAAVTCRKGSWKNLRPFQGLVHHKLVTISVEVTPFRNSHIPNNFTTDQLSQNLVYHLAITNPHIFSFPTASDTNTAAKKEYYT